MVTAMAPAPRGGRGERKPTDPEARAAVRRVFEELFDVPAVLRRRKPLSALTGWHLVLGSFVMNTLSVAVNSRWADNGRKVARTMYMRDTRAFVTTMLGQMSLSVVYQCANAAAWWMRTRIGICWRERLTEKLHAVYFSDTIYYRQSSWADGVADPAQRIASDVSTLVGAAGGGGSSYAAYSGLTSLLQSYISTTVGATNAVWRLWFLMPDQRWLVPFVFVWSYSNLYFRNWFAPAMMRATLMAKASRISGAYRDAQGRLSQHAEAIISFGGVAAERRRLLSKLEESLENSRQLTLVYLRENLAMNLVGEVFSATLTHVLVRRRTNTTGIWVAFFRRVPAMVVRTGPLADAPAVLLGEGWAERLGGAADAGQRQHLGRDCAEGEPDPKRAVLRGAPLAARPDHAAELRLRHPHRGPARPRR